MEEEPQETINEPFLMQRYPRSDNRFFPPNVLGDQPEFHNLKERVYAAHLDAMNERPLFPPSMDEVEVFRLLYLPCFEGSAVVRLTKSEGIWQAVTKRCDGDAGFCPGRIIAETSRSLSHAQTQQFQSHIDAAHFWDMPSYEESAGLDGCDVVLEGVCKGKYHVVDRWSPHNSPYTELALYLLRIHRSWFAKFVNWWGGSKEL